MVESEVIYKVLLVGESGVGKTSLIRTLTGCPFSHNMLSTVGVDFVKVPFEVDGAKIKLQIWDTAGQERFRSITRFQYRATKGLMLVYDVTSKESFETLEYWIQTIEKDFDHNGNEPIPIILVGNKCDLESKKVVSYQCGKSLSEKNFFAGFYETSAANGSNVRQSFQSLANAIVDVFNPEMMDMYRLSSAIDTIKRTSTCPDEEVVFYQNNNNIVKNRIYPKSSTIFDKPIKLTSQKQKNKKKSRCGCAKL